MRPPPGGRADSLMNTRWIEVKRSFFRGRQSLAVGDVVELPIVFANEVVSSGKAVPATKPEPEVKPPKKPKAPKPEESDHAE